MLTKRAQLLPEMANLSSSILFRKSLKTGYIVGSFRKNAGNREKELDLFAELCLG